MASEQLDLIDSALDKVGLGGQRVGTSLRRLVDAKIVTLEAIEGGGVKVLATDEGRKFLAQLRAYRLSI